LGSVEKVGFSSGGTSNTKFLALVTKEACEGGSPTIACGGMTGVVFVVAVLVVVVVMYGT